jgi:uncharacterized protein
MPSYTTPGVYRSPTVEPRAGVGLVRTDVAAFAGYAERGPIAPASFGVEPFDPLQWALAVTSWDEYNVHLGGFLENGYLPWAVRAFFENGGTKCYVVRVAASAAADPLARPRVAAFTLPAATTAVAATVLAAAAGDGAATIELTAPGLIAAGDILGLDSGGAAEVVVVESIAGTTVTLQTPLALRHDAGTGVAKVRGSALAAPLDAGSMTIAVASTAAFAAGDPVGIVSSGVTEATTIETIAGPALLRITRKTARAHPAGAVIAWTRGAEVRATSAGNWGNRIRLQISPLEDGDVVTTFALKVSADPGIGETQPEVEFYPRLSLDPADTNFAPKLLAGSHLVELTTTGAAASTLLVGSGPLAGGDIRLAGGRDGLAAVTVNDFTGSGSDPRGLRLFEDIEDVAMLAIPDAIFTGAVPPPPPPPPPSHPCDPPPSPSPPAPGAGDDTAMPPALDTPRIQSAMIDQCVRTRYRIAILDTPDDLRPRQVEPRAASLRSIDGKFAALYYPWLKVPDVTATDTRTRRVPPSGHVAGALAANDLTLGVQHPPGNLELEFLVDVGEEITDAQQGNLNEAHVNAIRALPGRGIRIWGARALNSQTQEQWRFIHVRRLLSYIEHSIEKATQWAVFEPNDATLRQALSHSLSVFLEGIWARGGLKGALATDGFFVKCDETNNPGNVVDAGLLVCQIGVAIAAPMEFIVFEMRRSVTGSQVVEE